MESAKRRMEITVVNLGKEVIRRGGYLFAPRAERTVRVTKAGYAEIKACQLLNVFDPGLRCDYSGCTFVAKNEASLKFHKRKHEREYEKVGEMISG